MGCSSSLFFRSQSLLLARTTHMSSEPAPGVRDLVFISYRRDDARGSSGRLYDSFKFAFGRDHVFRDVDRIGVGKWRQRIDDALARTAACIAVIGPRWANDEHLIRLRDPDDMVRYELVAALGDEAITVVPTLVEGSSTPRLDSLPSDLRPLFDDWNRCCITEEGWEDDTRRLIDRVAKATDMPLAGDFGDWLNSTAANDQRLAYLEQSQRLQRGQIAALTDTVASLRGKVSDAYGTDRAELTSAFDALARGDSLAAEAVFEREYRVQNELATAGRLKAAEAARSVANLAIVRDVTKAVSFYRKALSADPNDAEATRLLGIALDLTGDLPGAEAAMSDSLRISRQEQDVRGEMAAQFGLGDVLLRSKGLVAAQAAYSEARRLAAQRLTTDEASPECLSDLSFAEEKLGDVLVAQGDSQHALTAYRGALSVAQVLEACDPTSVRWQRDLSARLIKVGGVLMSLGDQTGALEAFAKALANRESLAAGDLANTTWQADLSVSYEKMGDVLLERGDAGEALAAYRSVLKIWKELDERDSTNTMWKRNLAMGHNKIGDALCAQGDERGALAAYREALAIRESLAARDRSNNEWRRDISVSHRKLGEVLLAHGDRSEATKEYLAALAESEALVALDKTSAVWRKDVADACARLGAPELGQGVEMRRHHLRRGLALLQELQCEQHLTRLASGIDWFQNQLRQLPPCL
jgi:tetratricopeptide (TPR) repeat protein